MLAAALAKVRLRLVPLFDDAQSPTPAARLFNTALAVLIVLNVAGVVLESVPELHDHYELAFWRLEQGATAIFAVEYVLRVWTSIDLEAAPSQHPLWGRLRYMRSFFAIVDLISILP